MTPTDFNTWLQRAQQQPDVPCDVPGWVAEMAQVARSQSIHLTIADTSRLVPDADGQSTPPRYSAVLVLIGGGRIAGAGGYAEDATVLLTHRTPTMRTHSGQMAFPGGGWEAQDSDPIATALREAQEETGVDPAGVRPLAVLDPIYIDGSHFAVLPVLAYWEQPSPVFPASGENDWVKPVSLADLLAPRSRYELEFQGWRSPAFDVEGMVLWGFTALVLSALFQQSGWEQPWREQRPPVALVEALSKSLNNEKMDRFNNYGGDA